jgi:hypothetical protein
VYWSPDDEKDNDTFPPGMFANGGEPKPFGAKSNFDSVQELALSVAEKQPLLEAEDSALNTAKFWLPVLAPRPPKVAQGEVLLSIQLVPVAMRDKLPAGRGRSDPNSNPVLPPPVGRLQFSLNPFTMLYRSARARRVPPQGWRDTPIVSATYARFPLTPALAVHPALAAPPAICRARADL